MLEGRYRDALEAYSDARLVTSGKIAAGATINLGVAYARLGSSADAIAAFDELLEGSVDDAEPSMVAFALYNKAQELTKLDRGDEAIVVFEAIVAGSREEAWPDEFVILALYYLSLSFSAAGRVEEAEDAYGELAARFDRHPDPTIRERIGMTLVDRAVELADEGRDEEALAMYSRISDALAEDSRLALQRVAATALFNKGLLMDRGSHRETLQLYGEIVERFSASDDVLLRELTGKALVNLGAKLGEIGRSDEALVALEAAMLSIREPPERELREVVAGALCSKGVTLASLGRYRESILAFDSALDRFDEGEGAYMAEILAGIRQERARVEGLLGDESL